MRTILSLFGIKAIEGKGHIWGKNVDGSSEYCAYTAKPERIVLYGQYFIQDEVDHDE